MGAIVGAEPGICYSPDQSLGFQDPQRGTTRLATYQELSGFLADCERRAFKQALFAVRDEASALDIVQESMLKLVEKYSGKPPAELPLLFQRILQNTIRDHYRRQKVRSTWTTLVSSLIPGTDGEETDPLELIASPDESKTGGDPARHVEDSQVIAFIEESLTKLPERQRQAFLLRYWEGLDVAETGAVMGCSEGSVKTHCSRATRALAAALRGKGVEL